MDSKKLNQSNILKNDRLAELLRRLRQRKELSRGQVAKRLKLTPTVIYNVETGRTRARLGYFFDLIKLAGLEPKAVLARHLFSIRKLQTHRGDEIVQSFRNRLKLSQRQMAESLGYKSASIIHHFEKGIREPDVSDLFGLMEIARDDVRGLVLELCGDKEFAEQFPEGRAAAQEDWREYWAHFYVSAIRQIMRTKKYRDLPRYKPGYFASVLGITSEQERHALKILAKFGLIRWENAKPNIIPGVRIVVPKDTPKELLDQLKMQWWEFGSRRYLEDQDDRAMLTVDSLPVSEELYRQVIQKVRALQDELHNAALGDTEGLLQLSFLAAYVPAK